MADLRGDPTNGLTLANEIRNQMLYYKVLRDKHDNSLINTLQDLNNMLKPGSGQDQEPDQKDNSKTYFVKFEHTKFSDQNQKAMALLIILLERKNEILKNLSKISTHRQVLIQQQQKLEQAIKQ
jgi:hypothetical protein